MFTVNIRRLAHDIYTRMSHLATENNFQDNSIHPILKASLSSNFDAVVPDILTFRSDKDDPLDNIEESKQSNSLSERKIELIKAVMSVIVSWQVSEAFEQVCSSLLNVTKQLHPNISYGLKG